MVKEHSTFEIKELREQEENGIKKISGIANKFGVIDAYGDVTYQETFTKTVQNKAKVPVLWGHNMAIVIGVAELSNKDDGLWADMEINTNIISGKEAYEITKQLHNAGRPMQLSIGYRTVKATYEEREDDLIRHLDEVIVEEISLTPFGANSESEVQDVKHNSNINRKEFNETLNEIKKTLKKPQETKGSVKMKRLRELLALKEQKEQEYKEYRSQVETKSEITEEDKTKIKELLAEIKKLVTEIEELQAIQVMEEDVEKSLKKVAELKNTSHVGKVSELQHEGKSFIDLSNTEKVLESKEYKDAWLKLLQKKSLTDQEKKFLQVGTNPTSNEDASPAVPTKLWETIIAKIKQQSQLINYVTITNVSGNFDIPLEGKTEGGGWHKEGTEITGKVTLDKISLRGYEWAKMIKASQSALKMTIADFETFIIDHLVREFGVGMEKAIASGTGDEQPTGILVEKNIQSITLTDGLTYDAILQIIGSLPTSYAGNAKFVMARTTFYQQILGLKDKNDRPLVNTIVLSGITRFEVLGYEVIISDQYPPYDKASATDKVLSFGDVTYYTLNYNQPLEVKRDDSVYFDKGMIAYRAMAIADGRYIQPEAMINVIKGTSVKKN